MQICELWWAAGRTDWTHTAKGPNARTEHLWGCFELSKSQRNKHHSPGVSVYWWCTQYERSTEGLCEFTSKVAGSRADDVSLHLAPRSTVHFLVTPLDIDPSLLNISAFTGISQPDLDIELADIADKDLWVSKFKSLTADLEEVARQKATLAKEQKWNDIENLPKPDKLVFETWSAIPDTYMNMKKYAFGVLSIFGSTYLCKQVFSSMNFIKSKYRSHQAAW